MWWTHVDTRAHRPKQKEHFQTLSRAASAVHVQPRDKDDQGGEKKERRENSVGFGEDPALLVQGNKQAPGRQRGGRAKRRVELYKMSATPRCTECRSQRSQCSPRPLRTSARLRRQHGNFAPLRISPKNRVAPLAHPTHPTLPANAIFE